MRPRDALLPDLWIRKPVPGTPTDDVVVAGLPGGRDPQVGVSRGSIRDGLGPVNGVFAGHGPARTHGIRRPFMCEDLTDPSARQRHLQPPVAVNHDDGGEGTVNVRLNRPVERFGGPDLNRRFRWDRPSRQEGLESSLVRPHFPGRHTKSEHQGSETEVNERLPCFHGVWDVDEGTLDLVSRQNGLNPCKDLPLQAWGKDAAFLLQSSQHLCLRHTQ